MAAIKRFTFSVVCLALAAFCVCGSSHKMYAQRMNSDNAAERNAAARELRGAPRDPRLAPIIMQACADKDADVRVYGFYALGRVDPREDGVVATILVGMTDSEAEVRRAAVSIIGELNPFPSALLPSMIRALIDEDERVRNLMVGTFMSLEGTGISTLVRHLDIARTDDLRGAIAYMLGRIGPPAKNGLPRLKQIAAEDENEGVREVAQNAITAIEGGAAMPIEMPAITNISKPGGPMRIVQPLRNEEPPKAEEEESVPDIFDLGGFDD